MKVQRKSEIAFYEAAKEQHEQLKRGHQNHVKLVRSENTAEKERHNARKRYNRELKTGMRTVHRPLASKMSGRTSGMAHDQATLDKQFEPESLRPLDEEYIPDPEIIEEPKSPEFQHDEPDTYDVFKVKDGMMEFVQGGSALRAMPGSYVLTNERTSEKFIVSEDDFQTRFEKV